jgi:hypothetical protein
VAQLKFKQPCNDCPFRRDSLAGWCGSSEPEWFVESALSDFAAYQDGTTVAPCHKTVDYGDEQWEGTLEEAAACAGALIFARNNCKSPRDRVRAEMTAAVDADHERVFSNGAQFIEHHRNPAGMRSWEHAAADDESDGTDAAAGDGVTLRQATVLSSDV